MPSDIIVIAETNAEGTAKETKEENKCFDCKGYCCTYITQQMDTPRSKADFRHMLWQIAHQNIEIYQDDEGWFLLIYTPCRFLDSDGKCGVYEKRPAICRSYENDWCEFDEPASKHFKRHFTSYESLLEYCQKRFKRWSVAED